MDNYYYIYFYMRSRDSAIGKAGTPYYVGKGKGRRAYSNHRSVPVPKDKNNIVFVLNNLTEEQAFRNERDFISWYGRVDSGNGILRNLTDGGEGSSGLILSEEHKRKISEANKGQGLGKKIHSEESKRKIGEASKGRIYKGRIPSEEHKRKNSEAHKGKLNPMFDKTHSEETKRKISEVRKLYWQNKNKPSVTLDQFFKE